MTEKQRFARYLKDKGYTLVKIGKRMGIDQSVVWKHLNFKKYNASKRRYNKTPKALKYDRDLKYKKYWANKSS